MLNLDEHTITEEAFRRIKDTPDARLKEIMTSLIKHLHEFAREVKLTESEWMTGIDFLTRAGQKCDAVRQEVILLSDTLGLSQLVVAQNHSRPDEVTEQTILGPFHVENAPKKPSHGGDISGDSVGDPLFVHAKIVDAEGKPVPSSKVEVWHAGADGFYDVQMPNWTMEQARLRGVFETDEKGDLTLRTIMPLYYPIPTDGPVGEMMKATARHPYRPAHIHFMINHAGFDPLVTHIFVDGDKYLETDCVFGVRSSCIGTYNLHQPGKAPDGTQMDKPFYTLDYTFVLEKAHAKASVAS